MAQIDPLLKALHHRQASELILREGQQPTFKMPDGSAKAVSPKVLSRPQIVALLVEVAGAPAAAKIEGGESVRFTYILAGSGAFDCCIETADGFSALVLPLASTAEAAVPVAAGVPDTAVPATIDVAASAPPLVADPALIPDRPASATATVSEPASVAANATLHEDPGVPQVLPARSAGEATHRTEMEAYLRRMFEMGASDLHLSAMEIPMVRHDGEMMRLEGEGKLDANRTRLLLESIMPDRNRNDSRNE